MTSEENIEKKIWTTEQLEKIKALRDSNESEKAKKRAELGTNSMQSALKAGDKVESDILTKMIDQKRGVIVKIRTEKKSGISICDVKFGHVTFTGVPARHLRHAHMEKPDLTAWTDDLSEYVRLTLEYQKMTTKNLLYLYKKSRFTKEAIVMKHELSKREHVERRGEKGKKQITIKWEDFLKHPRALSFR